MATFQGRVLEDRTRKPALGQYCTFPGYRLFISGRPIATSNGISECQEWAGRRRIGNYWMNLQKAYELRLAEQIAGETIKYTVKPCAT